MKRGEADAAWAIVEPKLPAWAPVEVSQMAPVSLVTDAVLAKMMTPARRDRVLRAPRAKLLVRK